MSDAASFLGGSAPELAPSRNGVVDATGLRVHQEAVGTGEDLLPPHAIEHDEHDVAIGCLGGGSDRPEQEQEDQSEWHSVLREVDEYFALPPFSCVRST